MFKKYSPSVSIILTTKNSEKYIRDCLQSIKDQTYKNIEIIVVDNNSSDNTKQIASELAAKVYNHGPERSAQRNFGVKKAKGEYILYLDSDIILSKNVVKDCVNKFKNFKFQIPPSLHFTFRKLSWATPFGAKSGDLKDLFMMAP